MERNAIPAFDIDALQNLPRFIVNGIGIEEKANITTFFFLGNFYQFGKAEIRFKIFGLMRFILVPESADLLPVSSQGDREDNILGLSLHGLYERPPLLLR
jgi:hypothetical protein